MQHSDIHRTALRAALAVTGRARRGLEPALGAALALQLAATGCTTQKPPPTDIAEPNDDAPTTTAPDELAEAPATGACVGADGVVSVECCVGKKLKPDTCQPCAADSTAGTCLTCEGANEPGGDIDCCSPLYEFDMQKAYDYGCTPWGPPAPPVHSGITIAELMA